MVSKTIREMHLGRDLGVIVMAIRDAMARCIFNPPADTADSGGRYPDRHGPPRGSKVARNAAGVAGAQRARVKSRKADNETVATDNKKNNQRRPLVSYPCPSVFIRG